jgi:hypothetical protein
VAFPVGEVLPLLRRSAQERGFHAYARHLALDNFPEIAAQLPLAWALKLAGPRLQSKNLWIEDGTNSGTSYNYFTLCLYGVVPVTGSVQALSLYSSPIRMRVFTLRNMKSFYRCVVWS